MLSISTEEDYFVDKGKPFFYLADTAWSALTNTTDDEWERYLDKRKEQGFNVIQLNLLPQWDRSKSSIIEDYHKQSYRIVYDSQYMEHVKKRIKKMKDKGFTPAIVLLWCDYVDGTWATREDFMPLCEVSNYVSFAVNQLDRFEPIYYISGDTRFDNQHTCEYYLKALETIKISKSKSLCALHIAGGEERIPQKLIETNRIDFYTYQSGHMVDGQYLASKLAHTFNNNIKKKPVLNSEPCYEGHGYGNQYGRFSRFDVRKASWTSVLSGAKAGIAYGAHGIWNWHKKNQKTCNETFAMESFEWEAALEFEGAKDVAFIKELFMKYELFDLQLDGFLNHTDVIFSEEIIMASNKCRNKIVIYLPYVRALALEIATKEYDWTCYILETKSICGVKIDLTKNELLMPPFNSDCLWIGLRKNI